MHTHFLDVFDNQLTVTLKIVYILVSTMQRSAIIQSFLKAIIASAAIFLSGNRILPDLIASSWDFVEGQ